MIVALAAVVSLAFGFYIGAKRGFKAGILFACTEFEKAALKQAQDMAAQYEQQAADAEAGIDQAPN